MGTLSCHLRLLPAIALTAVLGQAQAQVFIPDIHERGALNTLIPGIVDEAGIMDTLDPGIADLHTATLHIGFGMDDTSEFIGFRYLDSLRTLSMSTLIYTPVDQFTLNGIPPGLKHLALTTTAVQHVVVSDLPAGLETLSLNSDQPQETAYDLGSMPDSLSSLLVGCRQIHWEGTAVVGSLAVFGTGDDFTVPAAIANTFLCSPNGYTYMNVNMAAVECSDVALTGGLFALGFNVQSWPVGMTHLVTGTSIDLQSVCFAPFPEGLDTLHIELTTSSPFCFPNWPASLNLCVYNGEIVDMNDVTYCSVLNSSCPGSNAGIAGRMFEDVNAGGQYDPGEPPLPFSSVLIQPNGYVVGCVADGRWEVGVLPGDYTIVPSSGYPYYQSFLPSQHTANGLEMGDADTLNDFAATLIPGIQDLQAQLVANHARPGFNNRLYLSCRNYGTVPMDPQLVLNYDADQTWVGSSIAPGSLTGNTAIWNLPTLAVGATANLTVDLNTAASVALGTPINHVLHALPDADDEAPSDNVALVTDSVVASFDPNDKLLSPAEMTPAEVQAGNKAITYTVRFQNTGTHMAERVLIVDTLPDGLQTQSIQFLAGSHNYTWYVDHGVLFVLFGNINLPDSTSDAANSHGFVRFSVLPENDLAEGTTVTNVAHIVFDFNAPITTPQAVFHVDAASAVPELAAEESSVYPNPAWDRLWIPVSTRNALLSYAVKDLYGREVLRGRLRNDGAIDVTRLPAGSYTITSIGPEGRHAYRFVKL